jgi:hypothetical protein
VSILIECGENVPKFSFHGHLSFFNWKSRINAPRLWKECLTGIGQGAAVLVAAIPNINEI